MTSKIQWRCFHCGETLAHFGLSENALPVCKMRIPGEHHLLNALREAEDELVRYRIEDSELIRAMVSMQADHAAALRRAEEQGYARGLADRAEEARAYIAQLHKAALQFEYYADQHRAKAPPDTAKAETNDRMAEACRAAIGDI